MRYLPILFLLGLNGCIMAGELRRCYGVSLPLVKIGICQRFGYWDLKHYIEDNK